MRESPLSHGRERRHKQIVPRLGTALRGGGALGATEKDGLGGALPTVEQSALDGLGHQR